MSGLGHSTLGGLRLDLIMALRFLESTRFAFCVGETFVFLRGVFRFNASLSNLTKRSIVTLRFAFWERCFEELIRNMPRLLIRVGSFLLIRDR